MDKKSKSAEGPTKHQFPLFAFIVTFRGREGIITKLAQIFKFIYNSKPSMRHCGNDEIYTARVDTQTSKEYKL